MIFLKEYQKNTVTKLVESALCLLNENGIQKKLVLKAPTGSGKTVMMGAWLQELSKTLPYTDVVGPRRIAYLWIAPNQLHQQSLTKLKSFFEETRTLRCLEFNDLSNGYLDEGDVLFFNWQSISRDDAVVIREQESGKYLDSVMAETRARGIEIVAILDEAHLFATKGDKAKKLLERVAAKLEVDVSATPVFHSDDTVVVKRKDVVAAQMIKSRVELNPAVHDEGSGEKLSEYLLKQAWNKHVELAKLYRQQGSPVRPLLLIQLPNDKADMSQLDKEIRETIELKLEHEFGVTTGNGKLAVWLSGEKTHLDDIERFDSIVEVLLFKQAIALGWDCPRAAVLLIFREIKSETFTVQTVGRILRMPEQKHYSDPALNQGYVYTNLSNDILKIVADDMDYVISQRATRIESYEPVDIPSTFLDKRTVRNRLGIDFRKILFETAEAEGWVPRSRDMVGYLEHNQKHLWLWNLNVKTIDVRVAHDAHFDGAEAEEVVLLREKYARTTGELDSLLHKFCLECVGQYAKIDSAPVLKMALILLMEEFLNLDELQGTKVILHDQNQNHVRDLIEKTLVRYAEKKAQDALKVQKEPMTYDWDVPPTRLYPEDQFIKATAPAHVLQDFFQGRQSSNPEKKFAAFLEEHRPSLKWWYKNGDSGKEHFAVPYRDINDSWSLFYVDFIVLLADGTLAFFDTKTLGSDPNAARKHNALLEQMKKWELAKTGRRFQGGIIIEDQGRWKFSRFELKDHFTDMTGWDTFTPQRQVGTA